MYEDKKLMNPLQINDWEFRKFISVILAIQFATWGSIGLDAIGLQIPILRQFISFIYLTFIPGILILRILKLHKLGNVETLLYTVGLSIATLMFTGFLMNISYPSFGIIGPISATPLIITISIVVLVLVILSYIVDGNFSDPDFVNTSDIFAPYVLSLCLLPFISIFGTYLVNFYNNNILLLILLIIISIIPIFIAFDRLPKKYFPLAIAVISISLLYHRSLISMNLWGDDIFSEYYYAKLVISNSYWDKAIYENLNSMLSVVLVPPIYSYVCDINLTWVFKVIFSLIYSLVPLALYQIFQKQTNGKIAFLSTFFFMAFTEFYRVMPVVIRQDLGELFLILLVLLIIDTNISLIKRSLLTIIFSVSLVASHYAIASLYMIFFIITMSIFLLKDQQLLKINSLSNNITILDEKKRIFRLNFVLLFVIITLGWYIYVSSSSIFNTITSISNLIITNIIENFLDPNYSESMSTALSGTTSILYQILKFLNIITMFFITIGVIALSMKTISNKVYFFIKNIFVNIKFNDEYLTLSYLNFIFLIGALVIPYLSGNLGTMRIIHLSMIFLAPFCIIGYMVCISIFKKLIKFPYINGKEIHCLKPLSLFFTVFLLFNSGLIHEVLNDNNPCSISLSNQKEYLEMSSIFYEEEIYGAEFLKNRIDDSKVYSDIFGRQLLRAYIWPKERITLFKENTNETSCDDAYVYFRKLNVNGKLMILSNKNERTSERPYSLIRIENSTFNNKISNYGKIYTNGGSEIYR